MAFQFSPGSRSGLVLNVLGFQCGWWACALAPGWGHPFTLPLLMLAWVVWHLTCFGRGLREAMVVLVVASAGTLLDTCKAVAGLIDYEGGYGWPEWLAPFWITALWAGFGATLGHSLAWLQDRPWSAAILGAIFGPLAYWGGSRLGALHFDRAMTPSLAILALVWGAVLPLLLLFARRCSPVLAEESN